MNKIKKKINIYGGGPAGLMAAIQLGGTEMFNVRLYEKNATLGRKFLVAGKGGFNLTNAIDQHQLVSHYSPSGFMDNCLTYFNNSDLRIWLKSLGISTYIGSSNRVFPEEGTKPIQVLNALKSKLLELNIPIIYNATFVKFGEKSSPSPKSAIKHVYVHIDEKQEILEADYHIFCFGGASWSKTGSDGLWTQAFREIGIKIKPFGPANCGMEINWDKDFIRHHEGKPIKNIRLSHKEKTKLGEFIISKYGIEGNAVYPLASAVYTSLEKSDSTAIKVDFKPQLSWSDLEKRLATSQLSGTKLLKKLNLSSAEIAMIKQFSTKEEWSQENKLLSLIKETTVPIDSLRPIEEAISTTGGIDISELNDDYSLKKHNNIYCIGEMVDWDTITGGFLLQACFSMGNYASNCLIKAANERPLKA